MTSRSITKTSVCFISSIIARSCVPLIPPSYNTFYEVPAVPGSMPIGPIISQVIRKLGIISGIKLSSDMNEDVVKLLCRIHNFVRHFFHPLFYRKTMFTKRGGLSFISLQAAVLSVLTPRAPKLEQTHPMEPQTRVELVTTPWQGVVLPLNYCDIATQRTRRNTKPPPVVDALP